jgi:hypothetical protein
MVKEATQPDQYNHLQLTKLQLTWLPLVYTKLCLGLAGLGLLALESTCSKHEVCKAVGLMWIGLMSYPA